MPGSAAFPGGTSWTRTQFALVSTVLSAFICHQHVFPAPPFRRSLGRKLALVHLRGDMLVNESAGPGQWEPRLAGLLPWANPMRRRKRCMNLQRAEDLAFLRDCIDSATAACVAPCMGSKRLPGSGRAHVTRLRSSDCWTRQHLIKALSAVSRALLAECLCRHSLPISRRSVSWSGQQEQPFVARFGLEPGFWQPSAPLRVGAACRRHSEEPARVLAS